MRIGAKKKLTYDFEKNYNTACNRKYTDVLKKEKKSFKNTNL